MKHLRNWSIVVLLGLGLAFGSLALAAPADKGAKGADKPKVEKSPVMGKYAAMATAAKLTPEQQTALAAKIKAMADGLKQFEESKAAQTKQAREQMDAVQKERTALREKLEADVMSAFTPEQVQAYQAVELINKAIGRYKPSEEQLGKAQPIALEAVKAIAAIKADDKEGAKKKAEITKKADADLMALLTPEQKQASEAEAVLRDARKGMKAAKLTPDGEKAVNAAAADAAKKLAELDQQKEKIIAEVRAKIEAEAAKTPPPAPRGGGKAKANNGK